MINSVGYRRVSKNRPCSICGKPDWCSTTATETISFCARSTMNADRISPHGWGVFYDHVPGFQSKRAFGPLPTRKKIVVTPALAPPVVRDQVYRKLIELSPASSSHEIISGRGGLRDRSIFDHANYGSLPKSVRRRNMLVGNLVKAFAGDRERHPISFAGVPGFWKDKNGELRLWSRKDSVEDLMLIPFVGSDGLIRACQIRFMRFVSNRSGRYIWLSSSNKRTGCGSGAPLHHARPRSTSNEPVLVTEGALKAATAQRFLIDRYVVGNSGVATSHREIIGTARGRPLEIAFDLDSFTNPHVARALAALVRLRYSDQASFGYGDGVRIVVWDGPIKGIDEALLAQVPLLHLSVTEWLKRLSPKCLGEATRQLAPLTQ
jgi:hypothetical protein